MIAWYLVAFFASWLVYVSWQELGGFPGFIVALLLGELIYYWRKKCPTKK